MSRSTLRMSLVVVALACCAQAEAAPIVFNAVGTVADITPSVDAFRAALGALNPPGACSPVPCTGGRREINWDAVGPAFFDPFPGDFFNAGGVPAGRTRGLSMTTPGTLAVSNTSFGFPGAFPPFSPLNIFGVNGSNQLDVFFHVPGQPTSTAGVTGMGIVFMDVEQAGATRMSFFDVFTDLPLGDFNALEGGNGSFSFLGVVFDSPQVGRVRVSLGDGGIDTCLSECVAMDDFIYGEPQRVPEPSTLGLGAASALLLAWLRRRR